MTTCVKCHKDVVRTYPTGSKLGWCGPCLARPPGPEYPGQDRHTVNSRTGWVGGKVGAEPPDPEAADYDPRDFDGVEDTKA